MKNKEYEEALLNEIKTRISANIKEMQNYKDDLVQSSFFDGANTALEELAVQFGLINYFGDLTDSK